MKFIIMIVVAMIALPSCANATEAKTLVCLYKNSGSGVYVELKEIEALQIHKITEFSGTLNAAVDFALSSSGYGFSLPADVEKDKELIVQWSKPVTAQQFIYKISCIIEREVTIDEENRSISFISAQ